MTVLVAQAPPRFGARETEDAVGGYLAGVMSVFTSAVARDAPDGGRQSVAEDVFDLLTHRRYCHLSRVRTARYRDGVTTVLSRSVEREEPLRFSYDIGPGYHASVTPRELTLGFETGLSELLILSQVTSFSKRVTLIYPPGARFSLVVDNLCALRTNDVDVALTARYCAQLRALIAELGLESRVDLLVESEEFDVDEYDRTLAGIGAADPAFPPTPGDIENVERFLGRKCAAAEAAERIERYRRATVATERLLGSRAAGVRLTQRAGSATLGFRPFHGGDSRTQCGEVAITANADGRLRPFLLTSRTISRFDLTRFEALQGLPSGIRHVTYAEPARQGTRGGRYEKYA